MMAPAALIWALTGSLTVGLIVLLAILTRGGR